jgi:GNAT superfamily N-acetyltransferase
VPWAHGTVLRTPSARGYWDYNLVRVEHGELDAGGLAAAAEDLQGGLRHRKLEVEDEALGAGLRPEFAATRDLRVEWYTGDDVAGAEDKRRFAAVQEPIAARRGLRAFVLGDPPIAYVTLAQVGDAVEIDQLYVTPAQRGRGLGSTLVAAGLAAGGTSAAWIEADDEDRPRALYERLGFVTAWVLHAFVRYPEG